MFCWVLGAFGFLYADELSAEDRADLLDKLGAAQEQAAQLSEKGFVDEGWSADLESDNAVQMAMREVSDEENLGRVSMFVSTMALLESLDVSTLDEGTLVYLEGYVNLQDGVKAFFG